MEQNIFISSSHSVALRLAAATIIQKFPQNANPRLCLRPTELEARRGLKDLSKSALQVLTLLT